MIAVMFSVQISWSWCEVLDKADTVWRFSRDLKISVMSSGARSDSESGAMI